MESIDFSKCDDRKIFRIFSRSKHALKIDSIDRNIEKLEKFSVLHLQKEKNKIGLDDMKKRLDELEEIANDQLDYDLKIYNNESKNAERWNYSEYDTDQILKEEEKVKSAKEIDMEEKEKYKLILDKIENLLKILSKNKNNKKKVSDLKKRISFIKVNLKKIANEKNA